jgi:membrane protease subunit HflK
MQSVLGNSSKVLIDQKSGSNLLALPLEKLMQQGAAAAVAVPETVAPPRTTVTPPEPTPADPARAREGLRSRER